MSLNVQKITSLASFFPAFFSPDLCLGFGKMSGSEAEMFDEEQDYQFLELFFMLTNHLQVDLLLLKFKLPVFNS